MKGFNSNTQRFKPKAYRATNHGRLLSGITEGYCLHHKANTTTDHGLIFITQNAQPLLATDKSHEYERRIIHGYIFGYPIAFPLHHSFSVTTMSQPRCPCFAPKRPAPTLGAKMKGARAWRQNDRRPHFAPK